MPAAAGMTPAVPVTTGMVTGTAGGAPSHLLGYFPALRRRKMNKYTRGLATTFWISLGLFLLVFVDYALDDPLYGEPDPSPAMYFCAAVAALSGVAWLVVKAINGNANQQSR